MRLSETAASLWSSPRPRTYSPITGLLYLQYAESGQQYASGPAAYEKGRQYVGRSGRGGNAAGPGPNDPPSSSGIKAIDPETGKTVWDFKTNQGSLGNGVLATAGGVVFAGTREGTLAALDAKTGKHLWHFQSGAGMPASPMSYAIEGKQYVAIAAGGLIYNFGLPE